MLQRLSFTCFLILAVSLLNLAARAQNPPRDRAAALRTLKGCATRPITLGCNEDTAAYLIGLHDRGDHNLLKPLLDAGVSSDGALAEILGDFYSNVLSRNPRPFLASVRLRPSKEQHHLCWMAGGTDGSGMPKDMLRDVQRSLRRISSHRQDRLSSVANICLTEVNR
jgi:hypothetical protein